MPTEPSYNPQNRHPDFSRNNQPDQPNQPENSPRRWVNGAILLLAALFLLFNLGNLFRVGEGDRTVAYSQFLDQVEAGKVREAVI